MTRRQRHILLPALAPLLFFCVALSPIEWLGCRTRGLTAFLIALISALLGVGAAGRAVYGRARGEAETSTVWWAVTALILAVPAVSCLLLA